MHSEEQPLTAYLMGQDYSPELLGQDHQSEPISLMDHTTRTRFLLVDDHPVFGDGLRLLLGSERTFDVIGQVGTTARALEFARNHHPDVILLDIELPDGNGLDIIAQLRRICPQAKVVVLTGHAGQEYVTRAFQLGARGYLQKDATGATLLTSLIQVVNGERVISQPRALTSILTEFSLLLSDRERARSGLTDQEIEILRLASGGLNNKLIGKSQFWSEVTVKRKMGDIYRKLEVTSRAQAVAEAIRLGFI